jgi:hypothetical protein
MGVCNIGLSSRNSRRAKPGTQGNGSKLGFRRRGYRLSRYALVRHDITQPYFTRVARQGVSLPPSLRVPAMASALTLP